MSQPNGVPHGDRNWVIKSRVRTLEDTGMSDEQVFAVLIDLIRKYFEDHEELLSKQGIGKLHATIRNHRDNRLDLLRLPCSMAAALQNRAEPEARSPPCANYSRHVRHVSLRPPPATSSPSTLTPRSCACSGSSAVMATSSSDCMVPMIARVDLPDFHQLRQNLLPHNLSFPKN